ncbi:hypothetical protein HPB52_006906 [Rhipicephalus sanguineus]|uniref:Uncharacterized protein n=1 Tax=Rhipicephalus sanguineus TaxID=34632 RepID=A0A9D4QHW1_RHISA|nr:hypothetical protein HPB52_006906 [Rhipicephalus sanguineus]
MEDHEMALLNEPDVATRRGNSANRDTTPDLSWLSGGLDAAWRNEDVDLGSDHSVIGIIIKGPHYRTVLGTARVTDWDKMRKYTQEAEEASENDLEADRKQTYAEWARDQKKALEKFTQEITTTAQTPFVDARLAHVGGPALANAEVEAPTSQQEADQTYHGPQQTDHRVRAQAMPRDLAEHLRRLAGQAVSTEDVVPTEAPNRPAQQQDRNQPQPHEGPRHVQGGWPKATGRNEGKIPQD